MIIATSDGRKIDTATDLSGPERHVLQKLFGWQAMAASIEQFRDKTRAALAAGWNNSGPIKKGPLMSALIRDMERKVLDRLASSK
jgi:hypothetical protein